MSNRVFKRIMIVCAVIIGISAIIIAIGMNENKKKRAMKLEHYSNNVTTYLTQIENVTSFSVYDGYVKICVDNSWYTGTKKDKEDYVKAIQDTLTALLSKSHLNDGFYQTLYFYNSNNQRIAEADSLGKITIKD